MKSTLMYNYINDIVNDWYFDKSDRPTVQDSYSFLLLRNATSIGIFLTIVSVFIVAFLAVNGTWAILTDAMFCFALGKVNSKSGVD